MKITPVHNHGKLRWRVNVQHGGYRKRMFFATREEALAFANAAGSPVKVSPRLTPLPAPRKPAAKKPDPVTAWLFGL